MRFEEYRSFREGDDRLVLAHRLSVRLQGKGASMFTPQTSIYHCEKCGNVVYDEELCGSPRCCDSEMVRVVSDFTWELNEEGVHKVAKANDELVGAIHAEHRALIRRLAAARDAWNRIDSPTAANYSGLRSELCQLREELANHFAGEERGGYLAHVIAASPALERQVSKLCLQHTDFLERLDELINRLKSEQPDSWVDTRADFGRLTVELRGHEAAETALAQIAMSDNVETTR